MPAVQCLWSEGMTAIPTFKDVLEASRRIKSYVYARRC
jgi:hypothetical protein